MFFSRKLDELDPNHSHIKSNFSSVCTSMRQLFGHRPWIRHTPCVMIPFSQTPFIYRTSRTNRTFVKDIQMMNSDEKILWVLWPTK